MTNLPDPGIGRNPPRYRMLTSSRMGRLIGATFAAFIIAGGIYYIFSVNQIPTAADTGGITTGQSTQQR